MSVDIFFENIVKITTKRCFSNTEELHRQTYCKKFVQYIC